MFSENLDKSLILNQILLAKENRAELRKNIALQNKISISFSLNIPGYPKTNILINRFFELMVSEIKIWFEANRIFIENQQNIIDEAGNFIIFTIRNQNLKQFEIKQITEKFEQKHKLGRFLDLDVTDENCQNISSGKAKTCFYCNAQPAIVCMREQKHNFEELRNFIFNKIENYFIEIKKGMIENKLTEIAIKSLLYEVSFSPKPGLVDFNKNGSHLDMNYFTFINSTSALSPYFKRFANIAFYENLDYNAVLPLIREIGLEMETVMFKATNNVNTQKGLIFLLGLSIFASSKIMYENIEFSNQIFSEIIKNVCKNITDNELINNNNISTKTHGEICFQKYGKTGAGARWEAENGFTTVFNFGIKNLEQHLENNFLNNKDKINFAIQKTLLSLISENNDSNILYRKGDIVLNELKQLAKNILADKNDYSEIIRFCEQHNISPGGSADLLAVSIFIFFVKHEINLINYEF